MHARCQALTCVLGILSIMFSTVSADIPNFISYQGKVSDGSGDPVADGSYSMRFRIYNVSTGGSSLWDSGVQMVSVAGGVFNVLLGESPQPALELAFDEDYWLLVTFDGINQTPRQRLASIGYAYMASGLLPGTVVSGALTSGNVLEVENTAQDGAGLRVVTSYGANPTQAGTAIIATTSGNGPAIEGYGGSNGGSTGILGSGMAVGVKGIVSDFLGTSIGPDIGVDGEAEFFNVYGSYGMRGQGQSHGGYFIGGSIGVYGRPAATAAGTGVYGEATATTGITYGVRGVSESTSGNGVYGEATATTGTTYGVRGESESTSGVGVCGEATATTGQADGVRGKSYSEQGHGISGLAYSTTGGTSGVYGMSSSSLGIGVEGSATSTTGSTYGVRGYSYSNSGTGVFGRASTTVGSNYGVWGESFSGSGRGVQGIASSSSGTTYGVAGEVASTAGRAVYGEAYAATGTTYGVYGLCYSPAGRAVYGHANVTSGECYGGRFETGSTAGRGVFGHAYSGSGTTYGVYGRSDSPSGYGVYYQGGINGSGLMRTVVRTSQGPTGLDVVTAAGSWVEDFGEGELVNGRAHIELDPVFLETVSIDGRNPMKVFVQLQDECEGTFVKPGRTGFDVIELRSGTSDARFIYRVLAKRKGFESVRLDVCEESRNDSYLYPELRGQESGDR